ncbi:MAG TPA: PilZ domain-containing protein, partial [Planctomycetota bacterium]|nr:PilZ domain-containing protein [Planctomycetota bacterium]
VNALLRQIDPQPSQQPRSFDRRATVLPVTFNFANSKEVSFHGRTLDLCEGGFAIECSDDLSLCDVCIDFALETPLGVIEGLGSIRFVRKDDGQDRWIAGVEILELTHEAWDRLTQYCATLA